MSRTVALIQARMGSTRLPGKILAPVLDRPMILFQLERLRRARRVDQILVVTTCSPADGQLCELLARERFPFYRGSEEDVLDRYYQAAFAAEASQVLRMTADCPLIDPALVDRVVEEHLAGNCDYTSSRRVLGNGSMRHTYPHGTDTEIMKFEVLARAWEEAALPSEREHVTMYIYRHPEKFDLRFIDAAENRGALRWTVDYPEDLTFIQKIYERLYPINPDFTSQDVYDLLGREPALLKINSDVDGSAGLRVSAERDRRFLSDARGDLR